MNLTSRIHWKYKNLTIVLIGLGIAYFLSKNDFFHSVLIHLGEIGYVGAFLAGILFTSTFTVATSALILITLANTLSPVEIGLIAGLGAVIGDTLIFNLVKNDLEGEIVEIYDNIDKKHHLKKFFHSKYFSWCLPLLGAVIIASPLPDELGVSIINLSKMSRFKFIIVSYVLNSIGIFIIVVSSFFT